MPLPLLQAVPAVASAIGLPVSAAPSAANASTIQGFASQFAADTTAVLGSIDAAVVDIVRVAYITCLLVGVLLYFTHLGRRLGKDLIIGGVLLVVMTEFVIPAVASLIG